MMATVFDVYKTRIAGSAPSYAQCRFESSAFEKSTAWKATLSASLGTCTPHAFHLNTIVVYLQHRDVFSIPFFGNSTATRLVCVQEAHEVLVLGDFRAAQRVLLRLPAEDHGAAAPDDDRPPALHVWVANMHLDHDHPDRRAAQGEAVVAWMERSKPRCDAVVLCGDLNASPPEPLHALLRSRGYRSAHSMVHGTEPQVTSATCVGVCKTRLITQGTWPSGIEAPLAEEGPFECLDYVYLWEADGVACRCGGCSGTCTPHSVPTEYCRQSSKAHCQRLTTPRCTRLITLHSRCACAVRPPRSGETPTPFLGFARGRSNKYSQDIV